MSMVCTNIKCLSSHVFHYVSDCIGVLCLGGSTLNVTTCECGCIKEVKTYNGTLCDCKYIEHDHLV